MRIDYSEPKKSYTSASSPARQDKESSGFPFLIVSVCVIVSFAAGFGAGWFLSQKATKRSFQAATEQKSLENSPQQISASPDFRQSTAIPQNALPAVSQAGGGASVTPPATGTDNREASFSFYKNLPNGQKSTVIGSGVNSKDENNKSKQPLQAAIPSNMTQPAVVSPDVVQQPSVTSHKSPESVGYSVQIASFPLKSEAEQSRNKLAAKGYNAYVVESNLGAKGVWYRVQIGKKMEQNAAKELAAKMGKGALIVPDHH